MLLFGNAPLYGMSMVFTDNLSGPYDVIAASESNRLLACNRVFEYYFELRSFWSSYYS